MTVKLQEGKKVPEIGEIQQQLYDAGYLKGENAVDSILGPKTKAAYLRYRQDNPVEEPATKKALASIGTHVL